MPPAANLVPANGNPPAQNPPPAQTNVRASSEFGQNLREIVTALLSLAIAVACLYILLKTFNTAVGSAYKLPDEQTKLDAYNRMKDVLLLALGFLGTVTGYYLGRVPAERQADAARNQADAARDAQKKAEHSEQQTRQNVRADLVDIKRQSGAAGGATPDPVQTKIDAMLAKL